MRANVKVSTPVVRTPRLVQLEGVFDLAPSKKSELAWDVTLPIEDREWNIGLVVGPSGCGKSTIIRQMFQAQIVRDWEWPSEKSVVDGFPAGMSIKEIVELLSSVGFSSPPSWVRPFGKLSNGEQFRAHLARTLAELKDQIAVIDEYSSVVDRTVAQIGSAALAKTVRRRKQQVILATCHEDVADWLQPDWVYRPDVNRFEWRVLLAGDQASSSRSLGSIIRPGKSSASITI